jgi:hypothetical protein
MELRSQVGELGLALVSEAASLLRLFDCLAKKAEVLGAQDAKVSELVGVGSVFSEGTGPFLNLGATCFRTEWRACANSRRLLLQDSPMTSSFLSSKCLLTHYNLKV